jgi:4-hydroxy-tetrahydrodipicolinate reductase
MAATNVLICGASGKMGARVRALAEADKRFRVVLHPDVAHVFIDFTSAEGCLKYAGEAAKNKKPFITGSTGLSPAQSKKLRALSKSIPVFHAPNFSPGVHVLTKLAAAAAKALPNWDRSLLDVHHKAKKDAPSGTALRLAAAMGGAEIASLREGDVVGDHSITLAGPLERLELTHRAHSRDVFARGALEAALWLRGKKPGFYGMEDAWG